MVGQKLIEAISDKAVDPTELEGRNSGVEAVGAAAIGIQEDGRTTGELEEVLDF